MLPGLIPHLRRFLDPILFLVAITVPGICQVPTHAGSISGTAVDEKGSAVQTSLAAISGATVRHTFTDASGQFRISYLPPGTYILCAEAPAGLDTGKRAGDPFVDSCTWLDASLPRITIAAGEARTGVTLPLKRGRLVTIRINDPKGLLPAAIAKESGNELSIRLSGPAGTVRSVSMIAEDAHGRDHGIVIPYDTPHNLVVQSSRFSVIDNNGRDVSASGAVSVNAARASAAPQYQFTVTPKGGK